MKNRSNLAAVLATTLFLAGTVALAASNETIKRNNFGAELVKQGRLDEAIVEFQSAVQADPRNAAAQMNLAVTYDQLGRADEAIAAYKKAAELDPGKATTFNNLGVLYAKKGLNDDAIQAFEQGLKVEPTNPTLQKNLETAKQNLETSKKNRDLLQERETRIAEARKQVEARPKDARAAYSLARVYASFDMQEQAFEWLGKALQLGFDDIRFVREDPVLAGLRGDPRFTRLLESR
jgi:tetratricopeptide (TPR) repeat protein